MTIDHLSTYHSLLQGFALTDVESNEHDLTILRYMLLNALDAAHQLDANQATNNLIVIQSKEIGDGLQLRTVTNTRASFNFSSLPFVGFISKKQPSVTADIQDRINAADSDMLLELAKQPALLSYVSLQLADENWFNLVVFAHPDAKHDILTTSLHHYAAYELAPHYYQWIRLHHGIIQKQDASIALMLHTTKHYTFLTPAVSPTIHIQEHQPDHVGAVVATL